MHFTCRSFIGKNTTTWWSQYWENEPDDSTKYTKGHIFGLISLSSNNSTSLIQQGHELIDQINSKYFSTTTESVSKNLTQITQQIKDSLNPDEQLDLALIVVLDKQVYISVIGNIQVNLQRQNQISCLIKGTSLPSTISGPIQNSDRIFVTSSKFIDEFTWDKIKTILVDLKIQNIEENFLPHLYSLEDQSLLSAVLIEIHSETDEPTPEIETQTPIVQPTSPLQNNISPVYVRQRFNFKIGNHQKIRLITALVLLIGLFISFYFGHQKNKSSQAESQFSQYKIELEEKLNNISAVKNLDLNSAYSTAKEAQEVINKMSALKIHSDEISQYQSQVNSVLSQTGDSDSFTPDVVYDTSLITSHPQFSKITFSGSLLYLLDSASGRVDSLNPSEKSTKSILVSDSVKSAQKILLDSNQIYLLFSNQIKSINKDNLNSTINFDSYSSVSPTDVQIWNGSVYVLDSSNQTIWKFTPNSSGFSDPQKWLKNDLKLEIGSKYLAIDGQVWTLTSSGLINLYTSGLKSNYKQAQTFDISSHLSFSANVDSDYLIFADKSKFIYVYSKKGEFVSKYNLSKFNVFDISFDSKNKIIYFLASDQKIYKITL